jgi:hypothetical protein
MPTKLEIATRVVMAQYNLTVEPDWSKPVWTRRRKALARLPKSELEDLRKLANNILEHRPERKLSQDLTERRLPGLPGDT